MGSMGKLCRHNETFGRVDVLWKEYFKDPSLWFDNRLTKVSRVSEREREGEGIHEPN
jgi:hypothetical protein